jgi:HupF/HypC family protein
VTEKRVGHEPAEIRRTPAGEAEDVAPSCSCVTCGDIAESMTVLRIDADRGLALCSDAGGDHHTVEIALVLPVETGDELLVHAGTAIA